MSALHTELKERFSCIFGLLFLTMLVETDLVIVVGVDAKSEKKLTKQRYYILLFIKNIIF